MINGIKEKIEKILLFDTNSSTILSQSSMTHQDYKYFLYEILEEDVPNLIDEIERLRKALEYIADRDNCFENLPDYAIKALGKEQPNERTIPPRRRQKRLYP